jgi:hypothetical protein
MKCPIAWQVEDQEKYSLNCGVRDPAPLHGQEPDIQLTQNNEEHPQATIEI